jgi:hypothetical protein
MTCGLVDVIDGGEFRDPRLVNPDSVGGRFANPVITAPTVNGAVTLNDAAAASLAARLDPLIDGVVDPVKVAAAFRDATNNLPLVPGTQLVTKGDAAGFRAGIEAALAALTPAVFAGSLNDSTNDNPLAPGTQVVTKDDLAASITNAVAGVFRNGEGQPLSPGTKILSADDVAEFVAKTICEGCGGSGVTGLTWDPVNRVLTVKSENGESQVTLSGLAKEPVAGTAPAEAPGTALPSRVLGSRTMLVGAPTMWVKISVGGVDGAVPWYQI